MKTKNKIQARLLEDPKANTYKVVWTRTDDSTIFFESLIFNSFNKAQLFMSNLK
tara:strand:+ start:1964 stop:2125 length:162 start_codon:yes stop_codon:yes gene_type:complete